MSSLSRSDRGYPNRICFQPSDSMPRARLLQTVLVAVTACLLLVLFYLPYWSVRQKTIAAHDAEQLLLAGKAIDEIRSFFSVYGKALEYFAAQPAIIRLSREGKTLMKNFLAIHATELSAITRIDASGRIEYTVPEDPEVIGRDVSGQPHNRRIQAMHRPVISDVFTAAQGYEAIAFSYPVFENGVYRGAISFLIPFARVAGHSLDQVQLAEHGFTLLISRKGIGLYCPEKKHIGRRVQDCFAGQPDLERLAEKMMRGERGSMTLRVSLHAGPDAAPSRRHAVFAPIELPGGNYWSLAVVSPENAVLAAMRNFRNQWLTAVAAAICVLIVLSLLLTRSMARSRAEREKHQAEEMFVRLLDFTPMGVAVYTEKGEIFYVNQSILDLLEAEPEQVFGHNVFDFLLPSYHQIARDRIRRLLSGKKNQPAVIKVKGVRGKVRDVEIVSARFTFADQTSIITVLRDVTRELKRKAEQQRLVTAIEQARESVIITDADGKIEYVNPAFTRITGFSREESLGQTPRLLQSGYHDREFYEQLWQTLLSGQVWQGRFVNQRKDGTRFTELATVSPVRDVTGEITHFVAVKRDITHEVELEDKLRQAQKMEAIGTLAGGIAHDFNNILGAIMGFADMGLLQTEAGSPVHDALFNIRRAGKRAADLVQQILTFSRQSAAEKYPVAVRPLINESLKLLRASLPATITIHQELTDEDVFVLADPTQLQQVIINLCTNGFHAMQERGGELTVRLQVLSGDACPLSTRMGDERCLCLVVADTGTGMAPEVMERIFDPFFTTKKPGEGTGMGLSVVHGIIRDIGGEIRVESTPGQGTTFTIHLPLTEGVPEVEDPGPGELPRGQEHVVVIDDEEDILTTSRMMLEHLGYRATLRDDPVTTLNELVNGGLVCDLVLTDQTMPGLTGLELARRLKESRPDLPVVICTGYSDKVNEESTAEAGAEGLLLKPVELRDLAVLLRDILDRKE